MNYWKPLACSSVLTFFALFSGCGDQGMAQHTSAMHVSLCLTLDAQGSERARVQDLFASLVSERHGKSLVEQDWLYYRSGAGNVFVHFTDRMRAFPNLLLIYTSDGAIRPERDDGELLLQLGKLGISSSNCTGKYLSTIEPYEIK
jgi:hypothetical protein